MNTETGLFEIIFSDQAGNQHKDRLGIFKHAVEYAKSLIAANHTHVDLREVYSNHFFDLTKDYATLLEDVANAKRSLLQPTHQ